MGMLLKKLGAFFVALTMIVTMLPTVIEAAETATTWTEDGKNAEIDIDYTLVADRSNRVQEFHVKTARGLGFFAHVLLSQEGNALISATTYYGFNSANIILDADIDMGGKNWIGLDGLISSAATDYDYESFYVATNTNLATRVDDFYFATGYKVNTDYSRHFTGSFIGNNHTISNLTIQRSFGDAFRSGTEYVRPDNNRVNWYDGSGKSSYFLLNLGKDKEFKDVIFENINVVILDKSVGELGFSDAVGFAMIMENHGTVSNVEVQGNVSLLGANPAYYGLTAINRGTIENTKMNVNVDMILNVNRKFSDWNAYTSGFGLYGKKVEAGGDRSGYFDREWDSTVALVSGIAAVTGESSSTHASIKGTSSIINCAVTGNYNFYQLPKTATEINALAEGEIAYDTVTFDTLDAFKKTLPMLQYADMGTHPQIVVTTTGRNLVHGLTAARYNATIADSNTYDIAIGAGEDLSGNDGLLTKLTDFNDLNYNDGNSNNINYTKNTDSKVELYTDAVVRKNTETFISSVGGVLASLWTRVTDDVATNSIEIPIYLQTKGESSYRVRLDWGNMEFVYDRGSWDVGSNSYKTEDGNELGWNGHDNVNNQVLVTNQSNASVNAKLNLLLTNEKALSTEIYKEAGADTDSNEKDYTGKAKYTMGAYQAVGITADDNVQEFYVVLGGEPKGKLTNSTKIGSLTVTITSESVSEASEKAIAYLNNTTQGTTYAADEDVQLSSVKLGADKEITIADGMSVTMLGMFDANNHQLTLSNANNAAKLELDSSLEVMGKAGQSILSTTGIAIQGIATLKQNGLVWKNTDDGLVIEIIDQSLAAGNYTLIYLGLLDEYLGSSNEEVYNIYSDIEINATEMTAAKTLLIKDNAKVIINGTLSGQGTLKLAAASEGSVVYEGVTYLSLPDQEVIIK